MPVLHKGVSIDVTPHYALCKTIESSVPHHFPQKESVVRFKNNN